MKQLTDEELMHSVSQGNLDAMTFIFERYHLRIYNFCFQMLKDAAVCEDLTQNVFLKVMRYKHSYREGKFASWIFKIARNLLSDYYRERTTIKSFESIEHAIGELDGMSTEKEEEINHLMRVLNMLNEKDRELIVMNRLQGIKYDQIAEIIGSNTGSVKTRIHRIIKKIRTHYFETITP